MVAGSQTEINLSIGFTDLNESLNELEDNDLDALMAALGSELDATEEKLRLNRLAGDQRRVSDSSRGQPLATPPTDHTEGEATLCPGEAETKADKIRIALEKLKEATIKKLVVRVWMVDGSNKTLMVDEKQTVREVLDNLFEKTHCDRSQDWCLCETNPELQIERGFEDHEYLVEPLSAWTRDSKNQIHFLLKPQKYALFKDPQERQFLSETKQKDKDILLRENFEGPSLKVPNLEGPLYVKEDGKKTWKRRYFLLRASGIYYVPKGKTKSSTDLVCFLQFDKVNVHTALDYRQKYKAPTDYCFVLKHPCIQKESAYIRFVCCEDEHCLSLWVNSIRVAKYGTRLYKSYQTAVRRALVPSSTLCLTPQSVSRPSTPSTTHKAPATANSYSHHSEQKQLATAPPAVEEDYLSEPPPDFIPPSPPGGRRNVV
ncbi:amyloid beta A4 precursor protein-binding family B member 1-interacting protein-like [Aplochiton taeniatus]